MGSTQASVGGSIDHFKGQYVLHCHILEHEDEDMMQLVEVQEAACPTPPVDDSCETE